MYRIVGIIFILLVVMAPNIAEAQLGHSVQIKLSLSTTSNTAYIPGVGEKPSSGLSSATYTSPPNFFLASYYGDVLSALVFSGYNPISLSVGSSGGSHYISVSQNISNSKALVAFTKGDWKGIDSKMPLIETGEFFSKISPSFSFGMGLLNPIKMYSKYQDIDIQTSLIINRGRLEMEIESNKEGNQKAVIIRRL